MAELLLAFAWMEWLRHRIDVPATGGEWVWLIFGLSGQAVFTARFIVQWIHSERHKESRVPIVFWWLSIAGSLILLLYFIHLGNIVGILGAGFNCIPYTRNLMLIYAKKKRDLLSDAAKVSTGK